MSSVNKAIVIGRIGKDIELRRTPQGKCVCELSVATSEVFTSSGQKREETEWHTVVVWDKLAENCANYLSKGSSVYVEGKIRTRSWDDNGQKRYKTEIVAREVKFLDSKPKQDSQQFHSNAQYDQPQQPQFDSQEELPF